jgi:hypothetical protein
MMFGAEVTSTEVAFLSMTARRAQARWQIRGAKDSILFDLRIAKELCHLPEQGRGVFSPDGSLLAVPGQPDANEPVITFYNKPKGRGKPSPAP